MVTLLGRLSMEVDDKGTYQVRVRTSRKSVQGATKMQKWWFGFSSGEVLVAQIQCVPSKASIKAEEGGHESISGKGG